MKKTLCLFSILALVLISTGAAGQVSGGGSGGSGGGGGGSPGYASPVIPPIVTTSSQTKKLTVDDNGNFGRSVAVSGDIGVIGAPFGKFQSGAWSGRAHVFNVTTGQEIAPLSAPWITYMDEFGQSVGISGKTVVVGAPGMAPGGAVFLFDTTGTLITELISVDPLVFSGGNSFGESVAISGTTVIVGAPLVDNPNIAPPNDNSGAAYIFDATTGNQIHKLVPDDSFRFDGFGTSVAISGNIAIVGVPEKKAATYTRLGAAYLFNVKTGKQIAKLEPKYPWGVPASILGVRSFGQAVGISGNTAVVGADYSPDGSGPKCSGVAYLFNATTGKQIRKLQPFNKQCSSFGRSVAISGNVVVVGAIFGSPYTSSHGYVHRYELMNNSDLVFGSSPVVGSLTILPPSISGLAPDDGYYLDRFGESVAISGDTILVGATGGSPFATATAAAYVFGGASTWVDLGQALAGINGAPTLNCAGGLTTGEVVDVTLTNAAPSAPAWLVLGISELSAPAYGGVLVPSPDAIFGLTTSSQGASNVSFTVTSGLASGLEFYLQYWIEDAVGPFGYAASNAIRGTMP